VVTLPAGDGHPFRSQDVADVTLGDGYLELLLETLDQFCLGQGWILLFLHFQPGPALRCHLVRVAVPVIQERLPGGTSLAVAAAEEGQGARFERQAQLLAQCLKVFAAVEALEQFLLGQRSVHLTGSIPFHAISPGLR
jgi:hypothetical protein